MRPIGKRRFIMEQGKYRVKFRHLKTNRDFFHPQAQDFLNMVSLELEEEGPQMSEEAGGEDYV